MNMEGPATAKALSPFCVLVGGNVEQLVLINFFHHLRCIKGSHIHIQ